MNAIAYPLTLLYDAACPICALEMDHLRERDGASGRLRFVDIAAPGFDAAAHGATLAALNAELHAIAGDGTRLIGVPALMAAYEAVGLGGWWAPVRGPLRPLADAAYRRFARHRQPLSRLAAPWIGWLRRRRARHALAQAAACRDGACSVAETDGRRS